MKKIIAGSAIVLLAFFLAACGGGGESVTVVGKGNDGGGVTPPPGTTPPPSQGNSVHKLQFVADNATSLVTLNGELATEGNRIIHLVRFGVETTLPIDNVLELFWNGANATWHSSPGGTGIGAAFTSPVTTVPGLFGSDNGLPSLISNLGEEYFLNIENLEVIGSGVTIVVDNTAGLIEYRRDGTSPPPPPPPPPPVKNYYTIDFMAPDIAEITFGDNSISFGLFSSVDPADVRDVQWRGDSAGWTDASPAIGLLSKDADGLIHAKVPNMPKSDQGNFVIRLKNGETVWFDGGIWKVLLDGTSSPDAIFIGSPVGQFKYSR